MRYIRKKAQIPAACGGVFDLAAKYDKIKEDQKKRKSIEVNIIIREYTEYDIESMNQIWNEVVEEGLAFPQLEFLDSISGKAFFSGQSFCGIAEDTGTGELFGLYILHPNNIGRCSHISNASYAVSAKARGLRIGEQLVRHCLAQAKALGFRLLQFNAVVCTNERAIRLYEKLGFVQLGTIPGGFLMKDGHYEDIIIFYYNLLQT